MAAKFCPFCGAKLVENAKFCAMCGSSIPDLQESQTTSAENSSKLETVTLSAKDAVESTSMMPETETYDPRAFESAVPETPALHELDIDLGGYRLSVAETLIEYNQIRSGFVKFARETRNKFDTFYLAEVKDFETLYDKALPQTLELATDAVRFAMKELDVRGCPPISPEDFLRLVQNDTHLAQDMQIYIDVAQELSDFVQKLSSYRANNRSNNIQWQGGGFGLRGAIGGAIMAGVLNTGTAAVRGVGHAIVDSADRAKLKKVQIDLYKSQDHQKYIGQKLYNYCVDLFGTVEHLLEQNGLSVRPPFDIEAGINDISSAFNLVDHEGVISQKDYENALELTIRAMPYDPYFLLPYLTLYKIPCIDRKELLRLVRYFDVEEPFRRKVSEYEEKPISEYHAMPENTVEQVVGKIEKARSLNIQLCYADLDTDELEKKKRDIQEENERKEAEERQRQEAIHDSEQKLMLSKSMPEDTLDEVRAKLEFLKDLYSTPDIRNEQNRLRGKEKVFLAKIRKKQEIDDFIAAFSFLNPMPYAVRLSKNPIFQTIYKELDWDIRKTIKHIANTFSEKNIEGLLVIPTEDSLDRIILDVPFAQLEESEIPILCITDKKLTQGIVMTNRRMYIKGLEKEAPLFSFALNEINSIELDYNYTFYQYRIVYVSVNGTPSFQVPTNPVERMTEDNFRHMIWFFIDYCLFAASANDYIGTPFCSAVLTVAGIPFHEFEKDTAQRKAEATYSVEAIIKEFEEKYFSKNGMPSYYNKAPFHSAISPNNTLLGRDLRVLRNVYGDVLEPDEQILFYCDPTIGGTGKESFLMTNKCFRCHSNRYGSWSLAYDEIKTASIEGSLWTYFAINGRRVPLMESDDVMKEMAHDFTTEFFPFLSQISSRMRIKSSQKRMKSTIFQDQKSSKANQTARQILDVSEFKKTIQMLCAEFYAKHDANEFVCSGALRSYLGVGKDDEIYLAHDDTLFKSGKNGFIISSSGIYCKDITGPAVHTNYEELRDAEEIIIQSKTLVSTGKNILSYYSGNSRVVAELKDLFEAIQAALKSNRR